MEEPAADVLQFIAQQIDTVPQIEALLLLWQSHPATFTPAQLAERIFVTESMGAAILKDLQHRKFVAPAADPLQYVYDPGWDKSGELMARIAATYGRHLIRVATLIHSKGSPAVREFARAFESKKES